jgi:hypothetical protein
MRRKARHETNNEFSVNFYLFGKHSSTVFKDNRDVSQKLMITTRRMIKQTIFNQNSMKPNPDNCAMTLVVCRLQPVGKTL